MVIDANACNGAHRAGCATLIPKQIHTGTNPESISLDPRTHTLYVANELDNDVSVIDASRCNARVTVGCRPRPPSAVGARSRRDRDRRGGPHRLRHLGRDRCRHDRHPTLQRVLPGGLRSGACDRRSATSRRRSRSTAETHTAYVATASDGDTGSLVVLDTRTCNARRSGCPIVATRPCPGAGRPTAIAVNSEYRHRVRRDGDERRCATAFRSSTAAPAMPRGRPGAASRRPGGVDRRPHAFGPALICGGYFVAVAVNERSNTVYVTNNESCGGQGDKVFVYDGADCGGTETSKFGGRRLKATVTAGLNPFSLAVDQATNTVYAPLLADGEYHGNVAVINGATCNGSSTSGCDQTPALAPAGFGSIGVAVDPKTHSVYVTNIQDTSVLMRSTATFATPPTQTTAMSDEVASGSVESTTDRVGHRPHRRHRLRDQWNQGNCQRRPTPAVTMTRRAVSHALARSVTRAHTGRVHHGRGTPRRRRRHAHLAKSKMKR